MTLQLPLALTAPLAHGAFSSLLDGNDAATDVRPERDEDSELAFSSLLDGNDAATPRVRGWIELDI